MTKHEAFKAWLREHGACTDAYRWACKNKVTVRQAWKSAPHPEWIIWLRKVLANPDGLYESLPWWRDMDRRFGYHGPLYPQESFWSSATRRKARAYQRKNWKLPKVPEGL